MIRGKESHPVASYGGLGSLILPMVSRALAHSNIPGIDLQDSGAAARANRAGERTRVPRHVAHT